MSYIALIISHFAVALLGYLVGKHVGYNERDLEGDDDYYIN